VRVCVFSRVKHLQHVHVPASTCVFVCGCVSVGARAGGRDKKQSESSGRGHGGPDVTIVWGGAPDSEAPYLDRLLPHAAWRHRPLARSQFPHDA